MKLFIGHREYRKALDEAGADGQALFIHLWYGPSKIRCFNGAKEIGKLFDQDAKRLVLTARRLGVRVIKIDREGQEGQHIDLVGGPLVKARDLCSRGA